MKTNIPFPSLSLLIIYVFCLSACAAATNPLSPDSLAVKIIPAAEVKIVQTSARQDGDNVLVDGHIQRQKVHGRLIPKGHIDITIIDEHSKIIHQTFTHYSPEPLPRIHGKKSSFMAQIPLIAPSGSLVIVKFHPGLHNK